MAASLLVGFSCVGLHCSLIALLLICASIVDKKSAATSATTRSLKDPSFHFVLNDDDPFRISQDFLFVQREDLNGNNDLSLTSVTSGSIPIQIALDVCANSEGLTNLLAFTKSDEEFRLVLRNLTQQVLKWGRMSHGSRFYCHIFLIRPSCSKSPPKLQAQDFMSNYSNYGTNVSQFPFNWKSDLYLIEYCENDSKLGMKIWEVYSVKSRIFTKFIAQQNGSIRNGGEGIVVNLTEFSLAHINNPKIIRRQDLGGVDVTAAFFLDKDDEDDNEFEFKFKSTGNGQETTLVSGFSVSIFRDFQSAMNFTEKTLKIYFNLENYFEKAFLSDDYPFDINIFHAGVTKNRTKVAKPLLPTFFDGVHVIFIQPTDSSVRNIYRKPFALQMWSALFYTWTCIFLSCKLTIYFHSKLEASDSPVARRPMRIKSRSEKNYLIGDDQNDGLKHTTFEAFLWCIGTICQQGWYSLPNSTSTRLIITSGLLLTVISYSAYTGKIVSDLWDVAKPIKSLNQLLSYADKVYLISASDTSNDILEVLEQRSPEVLKKVRFRDVETIYMKLKDHHGKACAIGWPDSLYGVAQDQYVKENGGKGLGKVDAYLCDTFESFTFQSLSCMFIPKFSELEKLFNYRIIFGLERGFIRRYWRTYIRQTKLSCIRNNPNVTTLGFSDVFFAFFILWSGMTTSVMLVLIERLVFWVYMNVPVI